MPWLSEAMKDVVAAISYGKVQTTAITVDFQMGQPDTLKKYRSIERNRELKHLSTWRKRKQK